jgi:hypothetical protein
MMEVLMNDPTNHKYYMDVKEHDPTNHKIHSYVTDEYFYKGLERAKVEKLFINEQGRVDLFGLVQFLWGAFADGRIIALPNHECRAKVIEYISKINYSDEKIEAVADMIIEAKPKARKSRAKIIVEKEKIEHIEQLDQDITLATTKE